MVPWKNDEMAQVSEELRGMTEVRGSIALCLFVARVYLKWKKRKRAIRVKQLKTQCMTLYIIPDIVYK